MRRLEERSEGRARVRGGVGLRLGRLAIGLVALAVAVACSRPPVIRVDGFEVYQDYWNKTVIDLGRTASFDLDCPESELEFTLLQKSGRWPSRVGVRGCGRQATYVGGYGGNWAMNNRLDPQKPPPTDAPARPRNEI